MGTEKWDVNDIILLQTKDEHDECHAGIMEINHETDYIYYQLKDSQLNCVSLISETKGKKIGVLTEDGPVYDDEKDASCGEHLLV